MNEKFSGDANCYLLQFSWDSPEMVSRVIPELLFWHLRAYDITQG